MQDLALERRRESQQSVREFCVGTVPCLQDVASVLRSVSTQYCLFLALDAGTIKDEEVRGVAKLLLQRGLAYLCAWGPGCERVHDLFDLERLPKEPQGRVVMTTWHSKDSLPKALWFFEHCVEPAEGFTADCRDWVALSIGNSSWAEQIRTALIEAPPQAADQ